ncbi:putative bifunctional diguanylate cyclase/phosphodiesterase [Gynuella sp.]|uniref:putative bifunctional diguanylate cyclase/phosphodiesterase n=1 Tax=Gynuella sp. TaxID=2969146 RepID=UPI003D0A7583
MKLRVRFLINLSTVALLLVVVFGFLVKHMIDDRISKELDESLRSYFSQSHAIVQNTMNTMANHLNLIASDDLILDFFALPGEYRNPAYQNGLSRELQRYITYNPSYLSVAVLMLDGREIIQRNRKDHLAEGIDSYVQVLVDEFGKEIPTQFHLFVSKQYNMSVLSAYYPIFIGTPEDLTLSGMVRITVGMESIFNELRSPRHEAFFITEHQAIYDPLSSNAELLRTVTAIDQLVEHPFEVLTGLMSGGIELVVMTSRAAWLVEGWEVSIRSTSLVVLATAALMLLFFVLLSRQVLTPIEKFSRVLLKADPIVEVPDFLPDRSDEIGLMQSRFQELMRRLNRSSRVLEQQAYTDSLTGLPNRAALYKLLEYHLNRPHEASFAVMFLDLDGFKKINDFYGHKFGDMFLRRVTERLRGLIAPDQQFNVRDLSLQENYLFRLGGDEFTVILSDAQQVAIVADKIIKSFQNGFSVNDQLVYAGTSVGIAICPQHSIETSRLLQQADLAMYSAKRQGKMRYQLFNDELEEIESRRLYVEYRVRQAIDQKLFHAQFQAKVDTDTQEIIGFEALARLTDDEGVAIPPNDFITIAQEQGVLDLVTFSVLEQSCQLLQQLEQSNLVAAINICPHQLNDIRFLSAMRYILWRYQVLPHQIELELTEDQIIENSGEIARNLNLVRGFGFRTALDDFGVGYSSMGHLKRFRFNTLKLDRIFVSEEDFNSDTARAIINAIRMIASILDMEIVAEGVENGMQLEFLRRAGIPSAQGYYISPPLDQEPFVEFFKAGLN